MTPARQPLWVPYPVDREDPRAPRALESLFEGDSYNVRTAAGLELWANYERAGFVPCDDHGAPIGPPVEVSAVELRGLP